MKVAIVYDRVNKWGGAERVLLTLHEMFPEAVLFTSVYSEKTASWAKVFPNIKTSFLQKIPGAKTRHEKLAFLMPIAFESFDFSNYDLVISVTSEAAKGIITRPSTKHICYCLTPTRYLWSHYDEYFKGETFKVLTRPFIRYFRKWDKIAATRPDVMIAISSEVQRRIKKFYGRESEIVYPPISLKKFEIRSSKFEINPNPKTTNSKNSDYYLVVSRLVRYKRVDLVIDTFNELGYPTVIVGKGKEEKKLRKMAKSNITFIQELTDEELSLYYRGAKALIFPQYEDFGLVAVEAQMHGTPVIAYDKGGAKDIVYDNVNGILFDEQSRESLTNAIKKCEVAKFDREGIIRSGQKFSKERFKKELMNLIEKCLTHNKSS